MAASVRYFNLIFRGVANTISHPNSGHFVNLRRAVNRQNILATDKFQAYSSCRSLTLSAVRWDDINNQTGEDSSQHVQEPSEAELLQAIEYLQSEEYLEKYGSKPVWANYKRNHKGRLPPMKTRKRCIRGHGEKRRVCGNPCPICRDENLVIHYKNPKLVEQFICPHSWNIYSTFRTGVCQWQYKKLCTTVEKARQHGLIEYPVPFIEYNYDDYIEEKSDADKESKSSQV